MKKMKLDCRRGSSAPPLPLAGEGWGEGISAVGSPMTVEPSPGLSRKRER
jgi:hypothetical protein